MPKIDYFFTPLSPYTYLAGGALENIAEKVRASIIIAPSTWFHCSGAQAVLPCLIGIRPALIIVHRI